MALRLSRRDFLKIPSPAVSFDGPGELLELSSSDGGRTRSGTIPKSVVMSRHGDMDDERGAQLRKEGQGT